MVTAMMAHGPHAGSLCRRTGTEGQMWQPTPIRALALLGLRFPADEDRVFLVVSPPVFSDRARSRSPWPVTRTALYLDAPNSLRNVATVLQRPTAHSLASSSGNRSVLTVTSRPLKTN